jgi:xanthine dehydrogenase accessory factor
LDIYIEPVLPEPHLLILGRSPVAQTLARLGKAIHYRISVAAPGADREQFPDVDHLQTDLNLEGVRISPESFVVVSTQGESDEEALQQVAGTRAGYIAFVASRAKAEKVVESLRQAGVPADRLSQIRAPAGLDIRAASPEEIAVSVLAEIIQVRGSRAKPTFEPKKNALPLLNKEAKDPVCGMMVDISRAKYRSEHNGSNVYFCCAGCKQSFDRQPEKYALAVSH